MFSDMAEVLTSCPGGYKPVDVFLSSLPFVTGQMATGLSVGHTSLTWDHATPLCAPCNAHLSTAVLLSSDVNISVRHANC